MIIGAVALLVLSAIVAWTSKRISAPLRELAGIAERVAQGDISEEPQPRRYHDEIG